MPDQAAAEPANRFERRRARTRHALIAAAQGILAEQGTSEASIQQIAERADVGFGSFYNHFQTKAELFEAAVVDALEEYGKLIDSITGDLDDPAEVFAVSVRLTFRLADTHPELTRVLRYGGLPTSTPTSAWAPAPCGTSRGATPPAASRWTVPSSPSAPWGLPPRAAPAEVVRHVRAVGPRRRRGDGRTRPAHAGPAPEEAHEVARRPLPIATA